MGWEDLLKEVRRVASEDESKFLETKEEERAF